MVDAADYAQVAVEDVMGIAVLDHHDLVADAETLAGAGVESGADGVVEGFDAGGAL